MSCTGSSSAAKCSHEIGNPACVTECWHLELSEHLIQEVDDASAPTESSSESEAHSFRRGRRRKSHPWERFLRSVIPELIADLQLTGLDEKGNMSLWWPCRGMPHTLRLERSLPKWTEMLKDTSLSACFAVVDMQCLTYHGRDSVAKRTVRALCSGAPARSKDPVLYTVIQLNPTAFAEGQGEPSRGSLIFEKPRTVLSKGAKLRLPTGSCLEIRNGYEPGQLAFFEAISLRQRTGELAIVIRNGSRGHVHRELMNSQLTSEYLVPMCIVDKPY